MDSLYLNEYLLIALRGDTLIELSLITIFYTSIGNVVMPKLSEFAKSNDTTSAHNLWNKMIVKNAMITIPTVLTILTVLTVSTVSSIKRLLFQLFYLF